MSEDACRRERAGGAVKERGGEEKGSGEEGRGREGGTTFHVQRISAAKCDT